MKRHLKKIAKVLGVVATVFLLGAGDVTIHQGIVRLVDANKITILKKDGGMKRCTVTAATLVLVSGKRLSVTRVMPNSLVQIAIDRQDVCLQIVVEEVPQ